MQNCHYAAQVMIGMLSWPSGLIVCRLYLWNPIPGCHLPSVMGSWRAGNSAA